MDLIYNIVEGDLYPIFSISIIVLIVLLDYYFMVKLKKQKSALTILVSTLILTFIFPLIAYGLYTFKFKKVLKANCDFVAKSPNDNSVDMFLNYVKQWGFYNHPEQWNQVRGVWFIVNESSNVSTVKKKELRDYLIINGLKLHNSEKQIIDNYSK